MAEQEQHPVYQSGDCEIDVAQRVVRIRGSPIPVGERAFELIEVLAQSPGRLITKDELMDRVWPTQIVHDNTLQAHVSALRKALGDHREILKTEPGRGYRLVGDWTVRQPIPAALTAGPQPSRSPEHQPAHNIPARATGIIGRSVAAEKVCDLLSAYRLVTLTGPGGIGKSTLALHVVHELLPRFEDGAWLVELAPLSDPDLVPSALAAILDHHPGGGEITAEAVARTIGDKNLLLVLDNCEHVIDGAARLVDAVLRFCPGSTVLATSREVLRTTGECVYRVPPLEVPGTDDDPDDILGRSAVQLFLTRSSASNSEFATRPEDLPSVAAICRHLDGIPLAIEFAAARTSVLGIEQVAAALGERFTLLTSGRRTAVPRHRTLRAALDWSYDLLPEDERLVLRRLAVFAGSFSFQAVRAVAADDDAAPARIAECLANLVEKSLVTTDPTSAAVRYRLLETTRAYALEKLVEAGELEMTAGRHARRYLDRFLAAEAEAEAERRPLDEWLAEYGPAVDNLRAALDWAFSPEGDTALGVALTAAAVPLWMQLSGMEECRSRVERALNAVAAGTAPDPRVEMKLLAALAASLMYTRGAIPEVCKVATKVLGIAERLGDTEYTLRALFGLWSFHLNAGRQGMALTLAERFHAVAAEGPRPNDRPVGERMIGTTRYYLGDLNEARHHLERVLDRYSAAAWPWQTARFEVDQRIAASAYLARVLWLQGLPDMAMRTAAACVADARTTNHAISLGLALARSACPIALLTGDLAMAENYIDMLLDHSARHALPRWRAFGRTYRGMLVVQRGDIGAGLQLLRTAAGDPAGGSLVTFVTLVMAEALGRAVQIAEGLAAIEAAILRTEEHQEYWAIAELLRIRGEMVLLQGAGGASATAEALFRQGLDRAHRQGALAWELRCAVSLARLGHDRPARELLASVYARFTEGFETADLLAANALLIR